MSSMTRVNDPALLERNRHLLEAATSPAHIMEALTTIGEFINETPKGQQRTSWETFASLGPDDRDAVVETYRDRISGGATRDGALQSSALDAKRRAKRYPHTYN